jgi:hypothetical protein
MTKQKTSHLAEQTAEQFFHSLPDKISAVPVEIEGVLSGGFIVIKGERNFDRVRRILLDHARESEAR